MASTDLRRLLKGAGVSIPRLHRLLEEHHPDDPVALTTVRSWTKAGRKPPRRWAPRIETLLAGR